MSSCIPDHAREWYEAVRLAGQFEARLHAEGRWLDAWGVDHDAIYDAGGVGLAWIKPTAAGCYEPHPEPWCLTSEQRARSLAYISPCLGPYDLRGLCAWSPASPHRWYIRDRELPYSAILGAQHLDDADWREQPALVHPNPLTWLRSGACGLVILDWQHPFDDVGNMDLVTADRPTFKRLRAAKRTHPTASRVRFIG